VAEVVQTHTLLARTIEVGALSVGGASAKHAVASVADPLRSTVAVAHAVAAAVALADPLSAIAVAVGTAVGRQAALLQA